MGIKSDEGKWCYKRFCVTTGVPVMLQEGFHVDFEGENDVLRVWKGGLRLK